MTSFVSSVGMNYVCLSWNIHRTTQYFNQICEHETPSCLSLTRQIILRLTRDHGGLQPVKIILNYVYILKMFIFKCYVKKKKKNLFLKHGFTVIIIIDRVHVHICL